MADTNRTQMANRATALLAGPFLLGRRALSALFPPEDEAPPEQPRKDLGRGITVTPPEHAIKRRG